MELNDVLACKTKKNKWICIYVRNKTKRRIKRRRCGYIDQNHNDTEYLPRAERIHSGLYLRPRPQRVKTTKVKKYAERRRRSPRVRERGNRGINLKKRSERKRENLSSRRFVSIKREISKNIFTVISLLCTLQSSTFSKVKRNRHTLDNVSNAKKNV